jgi:predicted nucleic acid-binding protein
VPAYLLDTTTLVSFSKKSEPVSSRLRQMMATDLVAVCPIVVAEFYSGLAAEERPDWDGFFASLDLWDHSESVARRAGRFRYDYARRGRAISVADALVAATALEHDATILTDNVSDYPLPGVRVLSLRE